jgi:hypothetical protein
MPCRMDYGCTVLSVLCLVYSILWMNLGDAMMRVKCSRGRVPFMPLFQGIKIYISSRDCILVLLDNLRSISDDSSRIC